MFDFLCFLCCSSTFLWGSSHRGVQPEAPASWLLGHTLLWPSRDRGMVSVDEDLDAHLWNQTAKSDSFSSIGNLTIRGMPTNISVRRKYERGLVSRPALQTSCSGSELGHYDLSIHGFGQTPTRFKHDPTTWSVPNVLEDASIHCYLCFSILGTQIRTTGFCPCLGGRL
jgi:hypothetical protein